MLKNIEPMNELPARDAFFACLNTSFHLGEPGQDVGLLLTQVSEMKTSHAAQTFSILFHGPQECFLPQRIYRLAHPKLGEIDLFLVPVAEQAGGFVYQAVFNQLLV